MFKNLVEKLHEKTPLTIASVSNVRNLALRRCMIEELNKKKYSENSFLAEPFYEAMFPWRLDKKKLEERCCVGEVNPIIKEMHNRVIPSRVEGQDDIVIDSLYEHQKRSIEEIRKGKSIVVTTGTGSGKTECFMYPIFDYLANRLDQGESIGGVQALFLYPLNALIQSQGDRFEKFCSKFNEKYENAVHFANYTGKMEEDYESAINVIYEENGKRISKDLLKSRYPQKGVEYIDRKTLRGEVPQFLITNSAMLEYALIRKNDQPLFEKSDLQFIVLDEAHSYTGSDATELAMRLRRVLLAFGKKPSEVRFIATSATVGDDKETKEFIANIAGVPQDEIDDRIEIIKGTRETPSLPNVAGQKLNIQSALRELRNTSDCKEQYNILCRTDRARNLRDAFNTGSGRLAQQEIDNFLDLDTPNSMELLDFASTAKNQKGEFFIPLKLHVFQKHFPGVWACCNPDCSGRQPGLCYEGSDWKYGHVYFDLNDVKKYSDEAGKNVGLVSCKYCNHNVFQVVSCSFCGDINLAAQADRTSEGKLILRIPKLVDELYENESLEDSSEEISTSTSKRNESEVVCPALIHYCAEDSQSYRKDWYEYIVESDQKVHLCKEDEKIKTLGVVLPSDCGERDFGRCSNCRTPFHLESTMNQNGTFPIGRGSHLSGFGVSSKVLYSTLVKDVLMEDVESESTLPMGGRKLLGFTDSRQGTAYYAGRQGIVAEMAATRTWVLNYLLENDEYSRDELLEIIEERISDIGLEKFHFPSDLDAKKASSFAKLFLWREITFRSRRKRSLETLGLIKVDYAKLNKVHKPQGDIGQFFVTDQDYQNLIKVVLDYGFRADGALELDGWDDAFQIQKAYAGNPVYIKSFDLNYFDEKKNDSRSNDVAKIIHYYVKNDIEDDGAISDGDWQNICNIAKSIVRDLLNSDVKIIKSINSDDPQKDLYVVRWNVIKLSLPQKLWVCPSTKTLLDSVILAKNGRRYSPYMISQSERGKRLPVSDVPDVDLGNVWNSTDKKTAFIDAYRDAEWWTDLHYDVLTAVNENAFVVTQENTAQISSIQRERDQENFKNGEINILNCSTTMEMGVDIGDVSLVAMTNVPPHEYNYVQRAGRAGRAAQGQSFIWTLSSFGGHERKATKNPLRWVERNTLRQKLSMENPRIVQRHVNAYLLAAWIRSQDKYTIDFERKIYKFFLDDSVNDPRWRTFLTLVLTTKGRFSPYNETEFKDVLSSVMDSSPLNDFIQHIPTLTIAEDLLKKTQCSIDVVRAAAVTVWKDALEKWKNDVCAYYSVLIDGVNGEIEYENITKKKRSLLHHLRKLIAEYGLGYLIKVGVLPSNGMPIDVVELETSDFGSKDDYPSRERKIAIREFAPGYSLIVNGKRMTSRGISFNPISRGRAENMLIRSYFTCQNCGTPFISGIDVDRENKCSCCDSVVKGIPRKIVEPVGFRVLGEDRAIESILKPPFEQPHVKLLSPEKLEFSEGISASFGPAMIVYLNGNTRAANHNGSSSTLAQRGPRRRTQEVDVNSADDGYFLCLNCGFVATSEDQMDSEMHTSFAISYGCGRKKRGEDRWEKECKVEQFRRVSLAAFVRTDAFVLHIDELNDLVAANTWALALRNALTEHLALKPEEIGWTCQKGKGGCFEIVLFDNAAGGANLCTKCKDNLLLLFKNARHLLECESNCDSICLDCLLTRESQMVVHLLNRNVALSKLDSTFFAKLSLPEDKKYWGDSSKFHPDFFSLCSDLLMKGNSSSHLYFYLQDDYSSWNLNAWPMKGMVQQNDSRVHFVISEKLWNDAQKDLFLKTELWQLMRLGHLALVESLPMVNGLPIILEQRCGTECIHYIVEELHDSTNDAAFEFFWNAPQRLSCFYGNANVVDLKCAEVAPAKLFESGFNAKDKLIVEETRFDVTTIAEQLLGEFFNGEALPNSKIKELEFSDRYLQTASAIRYVCEIIKYLNPEKVVIISNRNTSAKTNYIKSEYRSNTWVHDYPHKHLDILKICLERCLPNSVIEMNPKRTPHDRCAWLTYEDDEKRLIRFTGSPTIWYVVDSPAKVNSIHTSYADIDPECEASIILDTPNLHMELIETTSIIVSK